jgi:hypothetical protein
VLRFAQQVGKGREGKGREGVGIPGGCSSPAKAPYLGSWCRAAAAVAQSSSESAARGVNGRREGRREWWRSRGPPEICNLPGPGTGSGPLDAALARMFNPGPKEFVSWALFLFLFFLRLIRASINTIFGQQMSNTGRGWLPPTHPIWHLRPA